MSVMRRGAMLAAAALVTGTFVVGAAAAASAVPSAVSAVPAADAVGGASQTAVIELGHGTGQVVSAPGTTRAYATDTTDGGVTAIDTTTGRVIGPVAGLAGRTIVDLAAPIDIQPSATLVFALAAPAQPDQFATVFAIDPATDQVVQTVPVPVTLAPEGIAVRGDGTVAVSLAEQTGVFIRNGQVVSVDGTDDLFDGLGQVRWAPTLTAPVPLLATFAVGGATGQVFKIVGDQVTTGTPFTPGFPIADVAFDPTQAQFVVVGTGGELVRYAYGTQSGDDAPVGIFRQPGEATPVAASATSAAVSPAGVALTAFAAAGATPASAYTYPASDLSATSAVGGLTVQTPGEVAFVDFGSAAYLADAGADRILVIDTSATLPEPTAPTAPAPTATAPTVLAPTG